jgi:dTDP-4-amino-4,6-dideoxygalactose transaminase
LKYQIPFNRPFVAGNEQRYVAEAISRGHISGNGHFTRRCEQFLEAELDSPRVILTTSCTDALEMAALLLELGPEDEVILPSFGFVSTVNAFVLRGARPSFVDIRPDTLNMDEEQLEGVITPNTRAIVPIHYAGVACQMDRIGAIARERGLRVIEDNAHALFGRFQGRPLGSLGDLAAHSFHETKNFTCGEGGALAIQDEALIARAEILRDKGTDRARFFRGEVDRYSWVDLGSSFLPSDLLAAFLLAQLEERDRIQGRRKKIWESYESELSGWAREHGVQLPHVPEDCEQSYHLFYMLLPAQDVRDRLIAYLKRAGILTVFHYQPLHRSEMGQRYGYAAGDFPVTEDLSQRLIRLPFFNDLSESDQNCVLERILQFSDF